MQSESDRAGRVVTPTAKVRRIFAIAIVVILALCIEAGSYVIEFLSPRLLDEPIRRRAAILREQSERIESLLALRSEGRLELDSILGWKYRAGYTSQTDQLNAQGMRARREYSEVPAEGTLRVAGFGDSFIYGNEVGNDDAWSVALESRGDSLEVLNYGVGGYGLDQALLRYQGEGSTLSPDVVLMGFVPDDLRRLVNVYRRFISSLELPLAKPRFVLGDDRRLVLLPNPMPTTEDYRRLMDQPTEVRRLGARDAWYSPTIYENRLYDLCATLRVAHAVALRLDRRMFDPERLFIGESFNPRTPAFAIQLAVFEAFARDVRDDAAIPAVVLLPDRNSVSLLRAGQPSVYAPMADSLVARQVRVWDAGEAFRAAAHPIDDLFASGGHYSPLGNRVLADWLATRLAAVRGDAIATRARRRPHETVGEKNLPPSVTSPGSPSERHAR